MDAKSAVRKPRGKGRGVGQGGGSEDGKSMATMEAMFAEFAELDVGREKRGDIGESELSNSGVID